MKQWDLLDNKFLKNLKEKTIDLPMVERNIDLEGPPGFVDIFFGIHSLEGGLLYRLREFQSHLRTFTKKAIINFDS